MNAPRPRSMAIVPIFITTAFTTAFLLWFIFTYLFDELSLALQVVIVAASATAVLILVAGGVFWAGTQKEHYSQAKADTQLRRLAIDELKIRIVVQGRTWHTAPAGHQVYLDDAFNQIVTPMHLQPGQVNGRPLLPSDIELDHWRLHQLNHPTGRPSVPNTPEAPPALAAGQQVLRPILPLLVDAQRAVIVGPSGTGKTTLLQWLVYERARFSKIILLDPHGQRPKWGSLVEAVGCGMRFDEIDDALRAIDWLMRERYEDIAIGAEHRSHPNVTLIIDELMAIVDEKQRGEAAREASTIIKRLATQARKTAIDVFLVAHSLLVGQTGLKGASDLLGNFTVVELHKDLDETRSCFLHFSQPGGKKKLIEHAMPGPFDDSRIVIRPDQLLVLPPPPTPEELKIIEAIRFSPGASYAEIARLVGMSNSNHTNKKIRGIIEKFGLEAYEIGVK